MMTWLTRLEESVSLATVRLRMDAQALDCPGGEVSGYFFFGKETTPRNRLSPGLVQR